ncbi:MAG: hypothetical protein K2X66_06280, partial [Cyanobacteria bacterium]|nr:hypothetical protein [Cyanobacteriota bacterium]
NVSLVDARRGNFFFGEDTTGGNAYIYQSNPSSNATLKRTNHLGIPIKPSPTIAYTSDTLTAGTQDPLGDYYFLNTTSNAIDHYHYDRKTSQYLRTSRLTLAAGLTTPKAITVDQSDASISVLGSSGGNWVIQKYANRNATLTATPSSTVTLTGITSPDVITPTGLSINGRTGDYLVLDSGLINSNSVRLLVVSNVGVLKKNIAINVTNTNLSTNASSETNFKIGFNDQENILYLIAPTIGSVYGLSLSQLF